MQVPSFSVFSKLYSFFSRRRKLLFSATLLLIALSAVASWNITMREDIEAMLPDDSSDVAGDFRLLQSAPFTRKIIISIKGGAGTDQQELIATADLLARKIASPDISNIATGPGDMNSGSFNSWLTRALPNLVTSRDISRLDHETGAAGVRGKLRESYERLLSP